MGFDILVVVRHLASNTPISGYLSKVPLVGENAAATAQMLVDRIQSEFGNNGLKYITLFTRERRLLITAAAQVPMMARTGIEITIPSSILEGSILEFQILELKEQA